MNGSDIGSIISGLTSASIIGYDVSQGTPVSTTLGPAGASLTSTGSTIPAPTLLIYGIIAIAAAVVLYLLVK